MPRGGPAAPPARASADEHPTSRPSGARPTREPGPVRERAQADTGGTTPQLGTDLDRLWAQLPSPPKLDRLGEGATTGGAVVTAVEPQATRVGVAVLEAGGNAVDAAIATAFALAVTHPSAGNIGGGGFLILRVGRVIEAIDFREDAPGSLDDEHFQKLIASGGRGAGSVGVPGSVAGLYLAHQRHGHLPWRELLEGAINLAENGSLLGKRQAQTITWAEAGLRRDAHARALFLPSGKPPRAGATLRRPQLATALRRIQGSGAEGFYTGETAQDIVDSLGPDGRLTLEDLARYRARLVSPLVVDYHGARVVTMPPPSAGGPTLTLSLSMLAASSIENTPRGSAARYHLLAEASRRAQVERRLLITAPERHDTPRRSLIARWTDPQTWLLPHPIDPDRATPSSSLSDLYAASMRELEHTTHLSVVDFAGDAVSLTTTLSGSFGAQLVTAKTGIVLNNSVASFGSVGLNTPQGGARTISSMAPTLALLGNDDMLVLGSPGGDTIPSTITQLLVALLDDGLSLADAVDAPRLHQGFVPDEISIERLRPLAKSAVSGLEQLGHRVKRSRSTIGDANVAAYLSGRAFAVYDAREGGLALAAKPPLGSPPPLPPARHTSQPLR